MPEKEWLINAKITLETEVIVAGKNEDEALANFDAGKFNYVDFNDSNMTDWAAQGQPKENK